MLFIPGGLTGRYQPLNVGVASPFKHWLHEEWSMTNALISSTPTQRDAQIAKLVESSWVHISKYTARHCFNHLLGVDNCATTTNEISNLHVEEGPVDHLAIFALVASCNETLVISSCVRMHGCQYTGKYGRLHKTMFGFTWSLICNMCIIYSPNFAFGLHLGLQMPNFFCECLY
jgi:hypothetical protein